MNEHELRHALAGHASSIHPSPDPDRLRAGLVRADRQRTMRTAGAIGAMTIVAALGLFATQAGETASPVDVVDQPESPVPSPVLPVVDDAVTQTTTTLPATTSTSAQVPIVVSDTTPDHLASSVTTTSAPAAITATTTTTTPPPTTTASPPPTSTAAPTTTAGTVAFSAAARYGSCEEDPPYDEYSGTATPGTTITITSSWSATTQVTADGTGQWFVRVEFPSAPVGDHFPVEITDGIDAATLDFVRTA